VLFSGRPRLQWAVGHEAVRHQVPVGME
jgi:hypothetical protein